jgi:hypothetical protein
MANGFEMVYNMLDDACTIIAEKINYKLRNLHRRPIITNIPFLYSHFNTVLCTIHLCQKNNDIIMKSAALYGKLYLIPTTMGV